MSRSARRTWTWIALSALSLVPVLSAAGSAPLAELGEPVPGVVIEIDVEPGGRTTWLEAFERHLVPAIGEAVEAGDLIDFTFHETVVVGQPYDFVLVIRAPSFAFFDQRQTPPHYAALFRREGTENAQEILARMTELETDVTVTLTRSYGESR